MIDIPHAVYVDILHDVFMAAFMKSLETGRIDTGQSIYDEGIDRLYDCLNRGVYVEYDVLDEIREDMGEHAYMLDDLEVNEMVLCALTLDDQPVFEAGRMSVGADNRYPTDADMKKFGEDGLRALGKATVKALRRHDMAKQVAELKNGAKGALGDIFSELLDEVIQEEIEDQCATFRDSLADMLTIASIPKPWNAPEGGEVHDLPAPG